MTTVKTNSFVKRQVAASRFSHFTGSWEVLEELVVSNFRQAKAGYKLGVYLIPVPVEGFYSGVVEIAPETQLKTTFGARREGEAPFVDIVAVGAEKLPARHVDIVVYSHEALEKDAETDAEFEIISINARPTEEEEPQTPMAMARNFLSLPGGTKAEYTPEQFANAIIYWSRRAMAG